MNRHPRLGEFVRMWNGETVVRGRIIDLSTQGWTAFVSVDETILECWTDDLRWDESEWTNTAQT